MYDMSDDVICYEKKENGLHGWRVLPRSVGFSIESIFQVMIEDHLMNCFITALLKLP